MASVAYHLHQQMLKDGALRLFDGSDGYGPGEQRRDFIHVDDVVAAKLWLLDHPAVSGIFNLGTGRAQTFNDVARAVMAFHGRGELTYIPFPPHLKGAYQSFTEADMAGLRAAGFDHAFLSVEQGVERYLQWLTRA
jgi:ADP-L-glycero-D-manno-heptose 6-epimerase